MNIQRHLAFLAFGAVACAADPTTTNSDDLTQTAVCNEQPKLPPVQPNPGVAPAMAKLNFLRGTWVGKANGINPDGSSFSITQTERVGPLLGGDVVLVEGRGLTDDQTTAFNALGAISWNQATEKYEMHAFANGRSGVFEFKLTNDGYVWEQPAGPSAVTRFTATFEGGVWHQVGEFIAEGKPPVQTFAMDLSRTGDTEWPSAMEVVPAVGR